MREFINRYGVVVISACLVLAAVIYFFFGMHRSPRFRTDVTYYVDESTGAESIQPSSSIPPLMNKDGKPTLVQEVKISCEGGKNPFVAYYRKYTAAAQAKINEIRAANDPGRDAELQDYLAKGELVRLPAAGSPWVASDGPDGDKVRESVHCANGQPAIAVFPP